MSLIKQLWMAVLIIVLLTFSSGFLVSGVHARNYYQEQLSVKNIDAATSMALTLSPMEKDLITIGLALSSQFDTGHYRVILLVGADGHEIFSKSATAPIAAPRWFSDLMGFEVPAGVAQVQDGWNLYGTLYVESETEYALTALWHTSLGLFFWFSLVAIACGLVGSLIMYWVNRPFKQVIEQAEALGERRFITSEVPKTSEFKRLVNAMNQLTERVKLILEKETSRFNELRTKIQLDPVMQIGNRETFMGVLNMRLTQQEPIKDALLLLRITELDQLNTRLGRNETDQWLRNIALQCNQFFSNQPEQFSRYEMGRLNGTDIAILLMDHASINNIAKELTEFLYLQCHLTDGSLPIILVGRYYQTGDTHSNLMAGLDQQIANLETTQKNIDIATTDQQDAIFKSRDEWRKLFQSALQNQQITAEYYPVYTFDGRIVHHEAVLRVESNEQRLTAQSTIGWARRVGMLPQLEIAMLGNALQYISFHQQPVALNISMTSMLDTHFYTALQNALSKTPSSNLEFLMFEFDEHVAIREPELFSGIVALIKRHGAKVGLQSAGSRFDEITEIERLGLEYIKVDAALVHACEEDSIQAILRSLCKLGQSLGFMMIAEGVQEHTSIAALLEIGFDALSGPGTAKFSLNKL